MNLDPITIILFLLFFVAPIVNNFLKRGQGGQGKTQRPSRPSSQSPSRPRDTSNGGRSRADTSADTRDSSSGNSGGFSQRLEEARRRVREAMSEGSGQASSEQERSSDLFTSQERTQQPPRQSSQQSTSSQGQASQGQGQSRQPFAGLGREGVSQRLPSQQGRGSSQRDATDLDNAPPLRVQRLGGRRGGKIAKEASRLEFSRNAVRQGVIWRELLDEPLAKRKRNQRTRRDPSQRP